MSTCAAPVSKTAQDTVWVSPSYAKPGVPVVVEHSADIATVPGKSVGVPLRLSAEPGSALTVDIGSSTGLVILGPTRLRLQTSSDGVATARVDVRSDVAGRHYLDLRTRIDGADGVRTVSVPVQVGTGGVVGKASPGVVVMSPDGTPEIVLGGQETIDGVRIEDPNAGPR